MGSAQLGSTWVKLGLAGVCFGLARLSLARLGVKLGLGLGLGLSSSLGLGLGSFLFSARLGLAWPCSGSVSAQPARPSLAGLCSQINAFINKNQYNLQNYANGKFDDRIQLRERKIRLWSGLGPALLQLVQTWAGAGSAQLGSVWLARLVLGLKP